VTAPVALESIAACFQGAIPSPLATCAADGTPNVAYLSIVHYVDSERVATTRQFFNKTRANLDANPYAEILVVDPLSGRQYVLDLRHLHTEVDGEIFEAMRANLDAVASQTGMSDVFRLRGVDVFAVLRCAEFAAGDEVAPPADRDLIEPLDGYIRRIAECTTYEQTTQVALEALDDLFGFDHAILLAADPSAGRLFAIASSGYPTPAVGAEVASGDGLIGMAAERRRVITVANLERSRTMAAAVSGGAESHAREVPLPRLDGALSAAAVPLSAGGELVGVLFLESLLPAAFGGPRERLLRIIGGHLATALAARATPAEESEPAPSGAAAAAPGGPLIEVAYYQADDSVIVDGEYLVKGVPGRILWRLLRDHAQTGRVHFSNRELRLDETLGLPAGNDNLEARLLVLRRRLSGRDCGITLERIGRGRLELGLARTPRLTEVPTSGPMRAAHLGNS